MILPVNLGAPFSVLCKRSSEKKKNFRIFLFWKPIDNDSVHGFYYFFRIWQCATKYFPGTHEPFSTYLPIPDPDFKTLLVRVSEVEKKAGFLWTFLERSGTSGKQITIICLIFMKRISLTISIVVERFLLLFHDDVLRGPLLSFR